MTNMLTQNFCALDSVITVCIIVLYLITVERTESRYIVLTLKCGLPRQLS